MILDPWHDHDFRHCISQSPNFYASDSGFILSNFIKTQFRKITKKIKIKKHKTTCTVIYLQLSLPIEVGAIEGNENLAIRSFVDIFYLSKIWELEALWTFFIKK